jgi:hypothetical protein
MATIWGKIVKPAGCTYSRILYTCKTTGTAGKKMAKVKVSGPTKN